MPLPGDICALIWQDGIGYFYELNNRNNSWLCNYGKAFPFQNRAGKLILGISKNHL